MCVAASRRLESSRASGRTATLELVYRLRRIKLCGERAAARTFHRLRGDRCGSVLTDEQLQQFDRDGYVLASGLIPERILSRAVKAMWRCTGASEDARGTWPLLGPSLRPLKEPWLRACYTAEYLTAAAQVAHDEAASFWRPRVTYCLNVIPTHGAWRWGTPHIDYANPDARHRVRPRAFRVATIAYLTDVMTHQGATVIWPGSHRLVEEIVRADERKFRRRAAVNEALRAIQMGPPVELTPRHGDVLLYHHLCVHASSTDAGPTPRLALRKVW